MRHDDAMSAPRPSVRVLKRALIDKEDTKDVEVRAGATVAEALRLKCPSLAEAELNAMRVVLYERDGEHVIEPDKRRLVKLKPGAFLVITDPPAGGGLRSVLQIVVAVATLVVAPYLAPGLVSAFGISTAAATALAAGVIAIAGNFLINMLFPPPDQKKASPLYSIDGWQNPLNLDAPIPLPVGLRHRYAPPFLVPPYIEIQNGKAYLNAVFCPGYAPLQLWNEKIGDRLLERFDPLFRQQEYRGFVKSDGSVDTSPLSLITQTVIQRTEKISLTYQETGVDEDSDGVRSIPTILETAPDTRTWRVIFQFPQGLVGFSKKSGSKRSESVTIRIRQRPVTPTNDAPWTTIEAGWYISRKARQPFFLQYEHDVGEENRGAYEVEFWRMNEDDDTNRENSVIELVAFQSILPEYPINQPEDCPLAMVAMRIKASNQLKGTLDEYNAEFASMIDALNPATEVYEPLKETGNPSDIVRWLRTMPMNAKRVEADALDQDQFTDWHAHNVDKALSFSKVYDYETSADAAIREVCALGRAAPKLTNGLHGVSIDRFKDPDTAYPITPHNSWAPEGKRTYKDLAHALRMKFRDRNNGFKTVTRDVPRPDFTGDPTIFEEIEIPGETDATAAYIAGWKIWLEIFSRADTFVRNLDWESRRFEHGDIVALSDRLLLDVSQSGRVLSAENGVVVLSEPVTMKADTAYVIKFGYVNGDSEPQVLMRTVRTVKGESRVVTFTGSGDMPKKGDRFWFGEEGHTEILGVVQSVEVIKGENGRLTILPQANEMFGELDDLEVPPFSSRVGSILPDDVTPPPAPAVAQVLSSTDVYEEDEPVPNTNRRIVVHVEAGNGTPAARFFRVSHRKLGEATWRTPTLDTLPYDDAVTITTGYSVGETVELRAQAFSKLGIPSAFSAIRQHVVGQDDGTLPTPAQELEVTGNATLAKFSGRVGNSEDSAVAIFKRGVIGQTYSQATAMTLRRNCGPNLTIGPFEEAPGYGPHRYFMEIESDEGLTSGAPISKDFELYRGVYDFAADTYTGPALTVSGGANGWVENAAGLWVSGRRSDKGRLVEAESTNYIRNNNVGASTSPSTLPTTWNGPGSGLTGTVVAIGTENGLPSIDLQISGTPTGANASILFAGGTQIVAANGETWVASFWAKLVAGSLTNVSNARVVCLGRNTAGTVISSQASTPTFTLTSTLSRQQAVVAFTDPNVGRITSAFRIDVTAGQPVNLTVRLVGVMLENAATPSSFIQVPSTTPVTRTADSVSLTLPSGSTTMVYTFDDNSQQTVSVSPGAYAFPTTLNRRQIRKMVFW